MSTSNYTCYPYYHIYSYCFILNIVYVKFDILLYIHLYWHLSEDGDLSLEHVGEFVYMANL